MRRPGRVALAVLLAAAWGAAGPAGTASAGPFRSSSGEPPASTAEPQRATATPVSAPTRTCRMYGSSAGFGMLCSDAVGGGPTLRAQLLAAGIDTDKFCWDESDLPDGFEPPEPTSGPGRWWLNTCLTFDGDIVSATNANLAYEFRFHAPGRERELTDRERAVIEQVTGRGQIPFLQAQPSPISSPRVGQDVAFSLLCDAKVQCSDTESGREVRTPRLAVGGVDMYAELVHLRVRPEGDASPDKDANCSGAGLPRTAEQLDNGPDSDPRVCRWSYERSSNGAGGGSRGDRYPARVTAYWQIFFDEGDGPQPLGRAYEKGTVNQIRVAEVQTLVVSGQGSGR